MVGILRVKKNFSAQNGWHYQTTINENDRAAGRPQQEPQVPVVEPPQAPEVNVNDLV